MVVVDDPAKYPPELRGTLDGRTRRWFMRNWPPQQLLPDAEPIYVKNWLYTMGVATLASMIMLFITGILLAIFGPEWWTTTKLGAFVDGLHYWSVELFFLFMMVHFLGSFFMGAFRGKRWLTWILGMLSFLTGVVTAFTGYSSLQDFEAQWLTTQGKDAINSTGMGALVQHHEPRPDDHDARGPLPRPPHCGRGHPPAVGAQARHHAAIRRARRSPGSPWR